MKCDIICIIIHRLRLASTLILSVFFLLVDLLVYAVEKWIIQIKF